MPDPIRSDLQGIQSLLRYPDARVMLVQGQANYEAAVRLFPANPVLGWDGKLSDHFLGHLTGKHVIVWLARSLPQQVRMALPEIQIDSANLAVFSPENPAECFALTELEKRRPSAQWIRSQLKPVNAYVPAPLDVKVNGVAATIVAQEKVKPEGEDATYCQFSQDEIAKRFTARHPELRYVALWGKWLQWTGSGWEVDQTLKTFDLARALCRDVADQNPNATATSIRVLKSAGMRAAIVDLAKADRAHAVAHDVWDADPMALATPGGIVDLTTGSIRPELAGDYCVKRTSAIPQGECPQWLAFLDQTTGGDRELQDYLQRLAGYALTGDTREHSLTFIYGPGGNGKGTFLDTIQHIIGTYACNASMEVFTEAKGERHSTELARLAGARLVVAQETEQGKRWAESRIKALTGGDMVTARFMRQDDFEFKPQLKLVIAGNHKPALRNVDEAMRRRLHMIPFMRKPDTVDKTLRVKLYAERDGILAWMVAGCLEWQRIGLSAPSTVQMATEEYFADQDMVAQWIGERCECDKVFSSAVRELHKNYRGWCESMHEPALRQGELKDALIARGYTETGYANSRKITGIRVRPSADAVELANERFQD